LLQYRLGIWAENEWGFQGNSDINVQIKVNVTALKHMGGLISVGSEKSLKGKICGEYKMVKNYMNL
jgi:hypothetical protein